MEKMRCNASIINVMKAPDHKSELHTQLLYNDEAELMEVYNAYWVKIMTIDQQTTGWVLRSQFDDIEEFSTSDKYILTGNSGYLLRDSMRQPLINGTIISEAEELSQIATTERMPLNAIQPEEVQKREILLNYLQAPYIWGGISIYGIDCSGLSKIFYRFFSIALPHLAALQMEQGHVVDFLENAVCGDLAFFENEEHEITHVGILLNNHEIVHASESNGKVIIDHIDNHGILSKKTGKRTHNLRIIKRLL